MFITWIFIIFTSLISISAFSNGMMFSKMQFNAYMIKEHKQWYRFFSYALIHANWPHLLLNMFVLQSFGGYVEEFLTTNYEVKGMVFYVLLYVGGVAMSVTASYEKHKHDSWYNAVGASGAVSAVVFSSIIIWPTSKIALLFFPFPMPAAVFGLLYLAFSAYMAKHGTDNIGHDAHFWGALFGVIFTLIIDPRLASLFVHQVMGLF